MMEFNLGFENGVVIKELLKTERSEELLEFLGKLPTKNDLLLIYKFQVVFSCIVYDNVSERRLLDYLKSSTLILRVIQVQVRPFFTVQNPLELHTGFLNPQFWELLR